MNDNSVNEIGRQRKMNMILLEDSYNKVNILDSPIDKLIESLTTKIRQANSDRDKLIELKENDPAGFKKLEEQVNQKGHNLHYEMYG
jgi:hypothetical protein